jgi:hypothetical protein
MKAIRIQERDLNLVMGPASKGAEIPFRVFLDGQPASADPQRLAIPGSQTGVSEVPGERSAGDGAFGVR